MTAVIGFTWPPYHDTSVSLVVDGKLVFASEEERYTRHKHSISEWPINAMISALNFAKLEYNIAPGDIDAFAINYDPSLYSIAEKRSIRQVELSHAGGLRLGGYRVPLDYLDKFRSMQTATQGNFIASARKFIDYTFSKLACTLSQEVKVYAVPHHLAHAASAFYFSGFKSSAVIVVDGKGENESTTIWRVRKDKFEKLVAIPWWRGSLGAIYEGVSMLLGFGALEGPGKVMGLAPYGTPDENLRAKFDSITGAQKDGRQYVFKKPLQKSAHYFESYRDLLTPLFKNEQLSDWDDGHRLRAGASNLAYELQQFTEKGFISLAQDARDMSGERNLCIAGGVALNSKANMALHYSGLFDNFFVFPAANDAGTSAGAAAYVYVNELGRKMHNSSLQDAYLGPIYKEEAIKNIVKKSRWNAEFIGENGDLLAKLVSKGKIVGIFSSRSEFGPRALGHRSLLADPTKKQTLSLMNEIKSREWWRPLAPSLLKEQMGAYFHRPVEHKFMALMFKLLEGSEKRVPAVCHVDMTARPQMVNRKDNPLFYDIIKDFGSLSGEELVVNTSFNLAGEPLVESPVDALKSFGYGGIDALYLDGWLIEKNK